MKKNVVGQADHGAKHPVEPKVKAATQGAGAGAVLSQFVLWGADEIFWNGDSLPPDVPFPVAAAITLGVTSGLAFIGGYLARHVNR